MAGKSGGLLNYSTTIDPARSIGEIMGMLATHGARKIQSEYDVTGKPMGIAFSLETAQGEIAFRLPVKVRSVYDKLREQK